MRPRPTHRAGLGAVLALILLGAPACATAPMSATHGPSTTGPGGTDVSRMPAMFDDTLLHEVALSFDPAEYRTMIDEYVATGQKTWIHATATIDGVTYDGAGTRLKGNSSLRGLRGPEADHVVAHPEGLPWLISLDRHVDGQHHQGIHDLVIRSNRTATSLNEAVALQLLERAGLPSQRAVAVSFRVDDSDPRLRLAVEHPDDVWAARHFGEDGALYKARAGGDYTHRGPDPAAYRDVFDQKAGDDVADLQPLIEFLDVVNHADDADFAATIDDLLDVDAFATYLAVQDLVANEDDIDGGGNNSYLWFDAGRGMFTVVAWDHNLAFGLGAHPRPDRRRALQRGGTVLVDRFQDVDEYADLVARRRRDLARRLYSRGVADEILSRWTTLLAEGAGHLVDEATIRAEAADIAEYIVSDGA